MVFHCSSKDIKSPHVSRTLLSILADLSNAVIWMFFSCSLISKFSSLLINHLEIVSVVQTTSGITVNITFPTF